MEVRQVIVMQPGDRFVTEQKFAINTPDDKQTWSDLQYWRIGVDGKPALINPPPGDVAAALLGRPA